MGEEAWKATVRESFKTWKQNSTHRAIKEYFNSVQVCIHADFVEEPFRGRLRLPETAAIIVKNLNYK